MALEHVLDQADDRLRPEARGIDLADTLDLPNRTLAQYANSMSAPQLADAMPAEEQVSEPGEPERRAMLERFAAAFEDGDASALADLLREDVVLEMPPHLTWFIGRQTAMRFFAMHVFELRRQYRLVDVMAEEEFREWGLRTVVVARTIERIGDRAVDIGEQTAYLLTAEFREFTDASHPVS